MAHDASARRPPAGRPSDARPGTGSDAARPPRAEAGADEESRAAAGAGRPGGSIGSTRAPSPRRRLALPEPLRIAVLRTRRLRLVRALVHFNLRKGPILASGMAYSGLFAIFAGVWVLFSVAAIILSFDDRLFDVLVGVVQRALPGLIAADGPIDASALPVTSTFTITGAIALGGMVWTALTWLSRARSCIRAMFDLSPVGEAGFFAARGRSLLVLLGFGLAFIVSSGLTVLSTDLVSATQSLLGVSDGDVLQSGIRWASLAAVLLFDTATCAVLLRVLSSVRIPFRRLWSGAVVGGASVTIIKQVAGLVVAGAARNPLAASFAAVLGLLLVINLLCTVLLLAAAWVAVDMREHGVRPRTTTDAGTTTAVVRRAVTGRGARRLDRVGPG